MFGESETNDNVLWPLRRDEDLNKLMMIDDGRNYFVFSHKKNNKHCPNRLQSIVC